MQTLIIGTIVLVLVALLLRKRLSTDRPALIMTLSIAALILVIAALVIWQNREISEQRYREVNRALETYPELREQAELYFNDDKLTAFEYEMIMDTWKSLEESDSKRALKSRLRSD